MGIYLDLVMLLNFLVDLLLLVAAGHLGGYPAPPGRTVPAALLGGVYGGLCLVPGLGFLGSLLWQTVFLGLMAAIAYGVGPSAMRRGILFVLLSMALGGTAAAMGASGFPGVVLGAAGVCGLCLLGFRDRTPGACRVPVQITYGNKRISLTALRDTGNTLRDPVSGLPVLVAGVETAGALLGMRPGQVEDPVGTVASGAFPGLRLIPYRAVGTGAGMLCGVRCPQLRIGRECGPGVVAFTARGLDDGGEYQALTGGV